MENAVDALKIAFALFIFVIAITLTFSYFAQAKNTSDKVLYYSDQTNFYDYVDSSDRNRKVEVAEVISTLYRYDKETISITVDFKNGTEFIIDNDGGSNDNDVEECVEKLLQSGDNTKFSEEFVSGAFSGIYVTGGDGSQITVTPGQSKLYVIYTEENNT